MVTFKRTSGICIPRKYENEKWYQEIKSHLTRHSREYQKSTFITNHFYIEGKNILKIPRFFPVENYVQNVEFIDGLNPGQDIDITHNITLRDDLQKNIVSYLLNNDRGIIKANPGSGKTVVSVLVVATIKKKTFILVHRDSLVCQWEGSSDKPQGFLTYTNISKDQIGRLSSANYKEVLKKSIILCTDQTFTSLVRRKGDEFLQELNQANIGLFIADEVHTTVGAPTFASCSLHLPIKRVFGLSATPYRFDNNSDIIEYHLGPIIVPEGKSSTMDARVTILLFDFGFIPKSGGYIFWGGFFQKSRYLKILKNSKLFMNISLNLLKKFSDEGKQIIYMGERIKLLELLFEKCKWTDNKSMFTGGAKVEEVDKQITFSTPGKIRDGVDASQKNCLIMSSPISNIDQMSGRILRIKEGKEQPVIIDMVDLGLKEIRQTLFGRLEFYKSKKWDIKFIVISQDGKKRELNESEVIKIIKGD